MLPPLSRVPYPRLLYMHQETSIAKGALLWASHLAARYHLLRSSVPQALNRRCCNAVKELRHPFARRIPTTLQEDLRNSITKKTHGFYQKRKSPDPLQTSQSALQDNKRQTLLEKDALLLPRHCPAEPVQKCHPTTLPQQDNTEHPSSCHSTKDSKMKEKLRDTEPG